MKLSLLAAFAIPLCLFAQTAADPAYTEAVNAFKKGDYATSRILFEMIADKNPQDQSARNYLRMIAVREKGGAGAPADVPLRSIIIPKADFKDVSVRDAVTFVAQKVQSLSQGKQALNVVWMLPEGVNPQITLSLQNIPASELMRYIAESARLQFTYDAHAVKIQPLPSPAPAP